MNDEQLKRLCKELAEVSPSPALDFSLDGASRVSLQSNDETFELGASGIRCQLREVDRRLFLEACSEDGSLSQQVVRVALRGGEDRLATAKIVLHEAETGGCQGRLCVGPLEKILVLGPDAQLLVYPPRLDLNKLLDWLLKTLREADEPQLLRPLATLCSRVREPLRQELEKRTEPSNWPFIEQVITDTMTEVVLLRRKDFSREPFDRLLTIATQLLHEAVEYRVGTEEAAAMPPVDQPANEDTFAQPPQKVRKRIRHDPHRPTAGRNTTPGRRPSRAAPKE